MTEAMWFADLESRLFTIFELLATELIGTEYDPHFGTEDESNTDAEFPYFYFHELPSQEYGMDLQNDGIHAVLENIEIQVSTNTSRQDCKRLSAYATQTMKQLRFEVYTTADLGQSGNVYRAVIRCRRMIGSEDALWTESSSSLLYPEDELEPEDQLHPKNT